MNELKELDRSCRYENTCIKQSIQVEKVSSEIEEDENPNRKN